MKEKKSLFDGLIVSLFKVVWKVFQHRLRPQRNDLWPELSLPLHLWKGERINFILQSSFSGNLDHNHQEDKYEEKNQDKYKKQQDKYQNHQDDKYEEKNRKNIKKQQDKYQNHQEDKYEEKNRTNIKKNNRTNTKITRRTNLEASTVSLQGTWRWNAKTTWSVSLSECLFVKWNIICQKYFSMSWHYCHPGLHTNKPASPHRRNDGGSWRWNRRDDRRWNDGRS